MDLVNILLLIGTATALIVIIMGAVVLYHLCMDRVEPWNPWADTVTLPAVPTQAIGRHRLDSLAQPFRLPAWD